MRILFSSLLLLLGLQAVAQSVETRQSTAPALQGTASEVTAPQSGTETRSNTAPTLNSPASSVTELVPEAHRRVLEVPEEAGTRQSSAAEIISRPATSKTDDEQD